MFDRGFHFNFAIVAQLWLTRPDAAEDHGVDGEQGAQHSSTALFNEHHRLGGLQLDGHWNASTADAE